MLYKKLLNKLRKCFKINKDDSILKWVLILQQCQKKRLKLALLFMPVKLSVNKMFFYLFSDILNGKSSNHEYTHIKT